MCSVTYGTLDTVEANEATTQPQPLRGTRIVMYCTLGQWSSGAGAGNIYCSRFESIVPQKYRTTLNTMYIYRIPATVSTTDYRSANYSLQKCPSHVISMIFIEAYRLPTNSFNTAWTRSAIVATSFKHVLAERSTPKQRTGTYRCSVANEFRGLRDERGAQE
jgi:hypothetical protein